MIPKGPDQPLKVNPVRDRAIVDEPDLEGILTRFN